jgi:hypothetical protein
MAGNFHVQRAPESPIPSSTSSAPSLPKLNFSQTPLLPMMTCWAECYIREDLSTVASLEISPFILPSPFCEPLRPPMPNTNLPLEDPFDDIFTTETDHQHDPINAPASCNSIDVVVDHGFATQEDGQKSRNSRMSSRSYYADSEDSITSR